MTSKTRVVVATTNQGKLAEFARALERVDIEVVGLDAIGPVAPIAETGSTFEQNARLKAEGYSRATDLLVLADDSGLEVDALDGAPGVYSARYGSPTLSDAARARALLKALVDVPEGQRTARFRCVIVAARRGKALATYEGAVEGTILTRLTGQNGFGYDPIFFHPPSGKSFAELTIDEKQAVSHRGRALQKLKGDTPLFR